MNQEPFSRRHGFHRLTEVEIKVRQDAPHEFRGVLIQLAYECGFRPRNLRDIVCQILHKRTDNNNWSEYPNIDGEIHQLIDDCEWYKVYDIAERIYSSMQQSPYLYNPDKFEKELNNYFAENGIGWQLQEGQIEIRGTGLFEDTVKKANTVLDGAGQSTANRELREAVKDLSRRPKPDVTGAIQHSMASLECVVREASGHQKATLGDILKRHKGLIPRPLDKAIEKAWGYASENARHIREGREPEFEEAELIVGVCASLGTYLAKKIKT